MKKQLLWGTAILLISSIAANAQSFQKNFLTHKVAKKDYSASSWQSVNKAPVAPQPAAIIWSDNFSSAANWTIASGIVPPNNQNWVIGTSGPSGTFALTPIASTTASNGFAMFDSDGLTTAPTDQIGNLTTANPIDCSTHPGVLLRFEQYYRRFYDSTFVFVSTNGTSWTKFPVNVDVPVNNYNDDPDGTPNPQTLTVNLTSIAGNQPQVWIRFQFYSPTSLQSGSSGWCYAWMIDDVVLEDAPANDMVVDKAFLGNGYSIYPLTQLYPIDFGTIVSNQGYVTQTGVSLKTTITPGGFSDSSAIATFTPGVADTLDIPSMFTPTANGTYSVNYTVSGLQVDNLPLDNTLTQTFAVHDYQFARDNGTYDGLGFWNGGDAYTLGNYYFVTNATTVGSIEAAFHASSDAGAAYQAKLFKYDGTDFVEIAAAGPFSLDASEINSANGPAKFKTVNFSAPVSLDAGSEILACIESFGGTDSIRIAYNSTLTQEREKTLIYDPTATTPDWYLVSGKEAAMLRMNVNGHVSVADKMENKFNLGQNQPNPFTSNTSISYELPQASNVQFEVRDVLGRLIFVSNEGTKAAGKHSMNLDGKNFGKGVYFYSLRAAQQEQTRKMIITK